MKNIIHAVMAMVLTGTVVGCGSSTPSAKPTGGGAAGTSSSSGSSSSAPAVDDVGSFAKTFLAHLSEGQPQLSKVSPEFKRIIGPPSTTSDKERGYSEWAATEWFKALPKPLSTAEPQKVDLGSGSTAVLVNGSAKSGPILLKLSKVGTEEQIDWFEVGLVGVEASLTSSEKSAEFAFLAFVNAALTGQTELAEALMTLSFKSRIAPPLPGDQGYNKGIVKSKLQGLRGNANAYTISKRNLGPESGTIDGSLLGGEPKTRPFSVKLVKGTKPGEWLIDDFEPR